MKRFVIIGSRSGLWYQITKELLAQWDEVVWFSRSSSDLPIINLTGDLTKQQDIELLITTIESYTDISGIILCAWSGYIEKFDNMNWNHIDETFQLNLISQIKLLSRLLPFIKKYWIDIVDIGATIGYKWNDFMPAYSISKWWLRWLLENIRLELKSSSARVIGIHPGWMDTESNIGPDGRETIIAKISWKEVTTKLINASDIAKLIISFLYLPKNIEVSEIIINRK